MASAASPHHNNKTRQVSVREWADPKNDSRYVTRHELKSFFTIYDTAAAKVRGQEMERIEGTLLMTLDALTKWKKLPWWRRLFTVPATPEVRRPDDIVGIATKDAEQAMPAPQRPHGAPQFEQEIEGQRAENMALKEDLDQIEHGASSVGAAPLIEKPDAGTVSEMPYRCNDCGTEALHQVASNDLQPLNPTCRNCGSAATTFTGGPQ